MTSSDRAETRLGGLEENAEADEAPAPVAGEVSRGMASLQAALAGELGCSTHRDLHNGTEPMYFETLSVRNFGPFDSLDLRLHPNGLNIIRGRNASGKTQLAGAIIAAIVGRAAIRVDREGVGPSTLSLAIREDEYLERVTIDISTKSVGAPEIKQSTEVTSAGQHDRALRLRLMSALSDPHGPSLLLGADVDRVRASDADPQLLDAEVPVELRRTDHWKWLRDSGVLEGRGYSDGMQRLARLIGELVVRRRTPSGLPLIVDDGLRTLDEQGRAFGFRVLEMIGESAQVVVLTADLELSAGHLVKSLDDHTSRLRSLATYNEVIERQRPRFQPRPAAKYVLGQTFLVQENRTCELKEVKGPKPLGSIKSLVDEYVVAFLNAGQPQEGSIVWGVRNEDLCIVGVKLSSSECDELRRVVTDKLHQITPVIAPTAYRVELYPVSDGRHAIPDLYVVEIMVPASRRTLLFSTGGQEVYVKTDSGKKKLTALEIQQELLRRLGIDPPF